MRLTVIPIVVGPFWMVLKGLERGLKELEISRRIETKITALLRSARILRKVLETRGDLWLNLKKKLPADSWEKTRNKWNNKTTTTNNDKKKKMDK